MKLTVASVLILVAPALAAADSFDHQTRALIYEGPAHGASQGPEPWYEFLSVCDERAISERQLSKALIAGLQTLGIPALAPNENLLTILEQKKAWHSGVGTIPRAMIEAHNDLDDKSSLLPDEDYKLSYFVSVLKTQSELIIKTKPYIENSDGSVYSEYYNSGFFHQALLKNVYASIRDVNCA